MELQDIGTISPSGAHTSAYYKADGTAIAEVPSDHPNPEHAANRALMLFLAADEWKTGETILQARKRMSEYLTEKPPVQVGTGQNTIIFSEA